MKINLLAQRVVPKRGASDPEPSLGTGMRAERSDRSRSRFSPGSIGIETKDGSFTPVVHGEWGAPSSGTLTFTTIVCKQTRVDVHVLIGESDFGAENRSLGRFELGGIPPAHRGTQQIQVYVELDRWSGDVYVRGRVLATGLERSMRTSILPGTKPSVEEARRSEEYLRELARARLREAAMRIRAGDHSSLPLRPQS